MSHIEAMRNAVEAMDKHDYEMADHILCQAIAEAEKQYAAKAAELEHLSDRLQIDPKTGNVSIGDMKQEHVDETAKQRHEWVGLTLDELLELSQPFDGMLPEGWMKLTSAIEAKLKDKNGY